MAVNTFTWNIAANANWGLGTDWQNTANNGNGTVPNNSVNNDAVINQGGVSLNVNASVNSLFVGGNGTANGALLLNQNGFTLTVANGTTLSNGANINING